MRTGNSADLLTARSWLFVPGDRADRFDKAERTDAHVVICDLEDAVVPDAKDLARQAVMNWLRSGPRHAFVRINAAGTPWHATDLAAISDLKHWPGIVIPKADATSTAAVLAQLPGAPVLALLETAAGIHEAAGVAQTGGAVRLAFGSIDYALDVGAQETRDALLHARSVIVNASRLGNLAPPVDGVTNSLNQPNLVGEDAVYAKTLGFGGKLCIHPNQVQSINDTFTPSSEEIDWALRIVRTADETGGRTVRSPEGFMIDEPVLRRARAILKETHDG